MQFEDTFLELAAAPMALTPRGGKHYIFRQPAGAGLRNTAAKLAASVDTRADGGYILVAPSVVKGKPYKWVDGSALDMPRESLPEPPAWLLEALRAAAMPKREPVPREQVVAIDATKPGDDFCQRATWGEILEPHGWTYESAAADGAERWTRPGKDDGVSATAGHCKSDAGRELFYVFTPNAPPLEAGQTYSKFAAYATLEHGGDYGAAATALAARGYGQRIELPPNDEPVQHAPKVGKFPKHLLTAPGFIGEVIDWNMAYATKPQPILALAGALSLLAVLTGRKVSDPYNTRTNLYCIAVSDSGSGKERARKVIKRVLFSSGLGERCKENPASNTGIVNAVDDAPEATLIYLIDEMGELLQTLTGQNAPAHLRSIMRVLMSLFTSSDDVFIGDTFADVKRHIEIINPHVSLYGATVPKSLYEAFTGDTVSNGFLSRMLIFESESGPQRGREVGTAELPESILRTAKFWAEFAPDGYGNLSDKKQLNPLIVPYTAEAQQIMEDLETLAYDEQVSGKSSAPVLWTRLREKARKLALLWACSQNPITPVVGREAAQWAAELAEFLTRKMLAIAEAWIAETPFQARRKRLLRTLAASPAGLTKSQLTRAMQHLTNRERTEILDSLLEGGEIRQEVIHTNTRPRTVFVAA